MIQIKMGARQPPKEFALRFLGWTLGGRRAGVSATAIPTPPPLAVW